MVLTDVKLSFIFYITLVIVVVYNGDTSWHCCVTTVFIMMVRRVALCCATIAGQYVMLLLCNCPVHRYDGMYCLTLLCDRCPLFCLMVFPVTYCCVTIVHYCDGTSVATVYCPFLL